MRYENIRFRGRKMKVCILTSGELLEVKKEAETLSARRGGGEKADAVCANACMISAFLFKWGKRVCKNGEEALEKLSPQEMRWLLDRFMSFNRRENPSIAGLGAGEAEELKKNLSRTAMRL